MHMSSYFNLMLSIHRYSLKNKHSCLHIPVGRVQPLSSIEHFSAVLLLCLFCWEKHMGGVGVGVICCLNSEVSIPYIVWTSYQR